MSAQLNTYRCRFVHRGHERVLHFDATSAGAAADHLLASYGRQTRILKIERAAYTEERVELPDPAEGSA